jgi:hypothetical protein
MNTANIEKYVAGKNEVSRLFGGKPLSLSNAKDRKVLAQSIDADLSPENLSCDGEAPASYVRKRYAHLCACAKELIKLDPSMAQYMYEFSE